MPLPQIRRTSPPYVHQEYPKVVFHPETGERRVAKIEGDVPFGWLQTHPGNTAVVPKLAVASHAPPDDAKPLSPLALAVGEDKARPGPISTAGSQWTRAEMIEILRSKGIPFNSRAPTVTLAKLLE